MRWNIIACIAFITVAGCTAGNSLKGQSDKQEIVQPQFTTGPATIVYKTKQDYGSYVPVLLSDDKTSIVSYPDPKDFKDGYPKPTKLKDGYLLDNRGITPNVAYLKWTYAQYAALTQKLSLDELMNSIIDKDPLTEMYNCGNRQVYKNTVEDLNVLIRSGQLKTLCKQLK